MILFNYEVLSVDLWTALLVIIALKLISFSRILASIYLSLQKILSLAVDLNSRFYLHWFPLV